MLPFVENNTVGGGRGIRTPDTREGMPVFKTGAFNRSAIPPRIIYGLVFKAAQCLAPTNGRGLSPTIGAHIKGRYEIDWRQRLLVENGTIIAKAKEKAETTGGSGLARRKTK